MGSKLIAWGTQEDPAVVFQQSKVKKTHFENLIFCTRNSQEAVKQRGTGNSNGGGKRGGNGKRLRPEQRRVPPTSL
jgi:hypothetical protein